jgi:TolA-binding protein
MEKKASPGMMSWLKSLQYRIAQILPKKSVSMTTGVAGVRGAKEDSAAKLYWKGKKGEETVTEEELTKFKACVDVAEKGERDNALKQLEDFMKLYPDSALIPDAKKTIDIVKAEPQVEAAKPQPAAEGKKAE